MPFVRFGQFRLLWVFLASCGFFWLIGGGFGWFWLIVAGFGWFWLVACFITNALVAEFYTTDLRIRK